MSVADRVRELVLPVLAERQLELYDIEMAGPVLRVVVDSGGERTGGLDMNVVAEATRAVSRLLDDEDPISGHYTLEVTSPGLERTLRTPLHFARAVGERVKVKTVADADGERRAEGVIAEVDDEGIVLRTDDGSAEGPTGRRIRYDDIVRARTVFEWGPTPKPKGSGGTGAKGAQRRTAAGTSDEKRERKS